MAATFSLIDFPNAASLIALFVWMPLKTNEERGEKCRWRKRFWD
jgi:hypothetical protein